MKQRWAAGVMRHAGAYPAVLIVGAALVARAPGFVRQVFDPDEAAIATMGMVVSRGGTLYVDVIDRKPPLAPLLYALSFWLTGNRDLRPLHGLAALALAGAALIVAIAVRREAGTRAGWWAAALMVAGAITFLPKDAQAANFSHLALLPACGAIVAARRDSARAAALAGVLLGVAVLTRQSWVIGIVPAALAAWWHGGRRLSRPFIVVATTAATIGAIGLVVPFGRFWHWTFAANGSVLDITHSDDVFGRLRLAIGLFVLGHAALCWLVLRRGWQRSDLDLWVWLLAGIAATVAGFRFFGHYWLQVLAPLCLLGAPAVRRAGTAVRRGLVVAIVVPTAVAWAYAWSPHVADRFAAQHGALIAVVRSRTQPNDRVAVWGDAPEVYWLTGREPGGALVTTDFLVGKSAGRTDGPIRLPEATPGALHDYLVSLRAHPPKLFLDTSTAHIRRYGPYPVALVPSVFRFLHHRYQRVATVQHVAVYELKASLPDPVHP